MRRSPMVDAVCRMLDEIEETEPDGDNEYPELIERLRETATAGHRSFRDRGRSSFPNRAFVIGNY